MAKSVGVILIVFSALIAALALLMYAFPGVFFSSGGVEAIYFIPLLGILACFVQIAGWGFLITGMIGDILDF